MDYTRQPLAFKARKAARYVGLYGVPRTLVKVRSQYHMARRYDALPAIRDRGPERHVGILGAGKFAFANIAWYLGRNHGAVMRGVMDPEIARAASLFERYDLDYFTDDAMRVVEDPAIDLVYVASNHASHAEYAIAALERGKHVHIEKPHVVSRDQLDRLVAAMGRAGGRVNLGFNRPQSRFGEQIARLVSEQQGAAMYSWFIAGHQIEPDHWYFREEEGGRILGNLCHWTDFVLRLVPPADRHPITIRPTRAERSDSDIAVTYTFGDGTIAAITFSAKGHTFEGVKERFAGHRGDLLLTMDDFRTMTVEVGARKRRHVLAFRDHGHERSILNSYAMATGGPGVDAEYVRQTGELFLATKEALEQSREVVLAPRPAAPTPVAA